MSRRLARMSSLRGILILITFFAAGTTAFALEECRLLRQPDIGGGRIVFIYAGDLWTVPREGGLAARLTSHEGLERFPKLSPDGRSVAFTAQYDGNVDAFVVPVEGGEPARLTWHPDDDEVAEWYPDGASILLRSARAAFIQRFDRFYSVPAKGGFETVLELPEGGYASFSPDGSSLAFITPTYDNRSWKRYKGGNAPEIWIYDLKKHTSEKITDWAGADEWPMWHGRTIYYSTDRGGPTVNLWAYDLDKKAHRQVTRFDEYDVKWPSMGGDSIVFEYGGYLHVMDLPSEKPVKLSILVPDDKPATRAQMRNVASWTNNFDLSPSGKRAVIEARGELFSVPAEKGDVRLLTATPGARERDPSWSPDGKWIAYLSDASGEYELHVIGSDGLTPDRQVTKGGSTFRYAPVWSPDSRKLVFSDKTMTLWWVDVETGKTTKIDTGQDGEIFDYRWAPDSAWITWSRPERNNFSRVMLYSLDTGKVTPVSDGMTDDYGPVFDAGGKYLYFLSRRTLHPQFAAFELNMHFPDTDRIYALPLREDLPSPVAPESDEESAGEDKKDGDAKKKDDGKDGDKGKDDAAEKKPEPVVIHLDRIGSRLAQLPVPPGRYQGLSAPDGKVIYIKQPPQSATGDDGDGGAPAASIRMFDLKERKDQEIISGVEPRYALSKDGGKLFYKSRDTVGIIEVKEGKKSGDGKVEKAGELMALVDPHKEWRQMYEEAWRLERDFYYDPGMGGLNWKAMGERYRQLLPYVAHRTDLNYILGELQGELATSHAYVGGGDTPRVARTGVGLLGADLELDAKSGLYRFSKIYAKRDWNSGTAAPLNEPGVLVKEGDYLLEVNGRPVRAPENVFAAFVGTDGRQTRITVGSSPSDKSPRTYTVTPVGNDTSLRYDDWVEANRRKVDEATGGRIAYIHVPNTAIGGIQQFTRQYYPQVHKEGIIVDERFNGGGFIPDFFVERLRRTTMVYWSNRDGNDFRTPGTAVDGPKCILVNEYAGSGGDAFPYYFRMAGLGPVIGKRTWGGLVGISRFLPLVDGGAITMPDFGMWDPAKGDWVVENHGVDPDIEVENAPHLVAAGKDPQLERGIAYVMEKLGKEPAKKPARPKYKVQSR
ncbi:MAG: S41 family peptidase [Candidatus Polarisedimenticolia bacterium]